MLLHRILDRQRIDDGRQHAHIISISPIHTRGGQTHTTKDVAAANHDGNLDTCINERFDFCRNAFEHGRIDTEVLLAHQGFAAELQQDSFIFYVRSR